MASSGIEIVQPDAALKVGWRTLYDGYATFYKREMTDAIAEAVWGWIHDPAHEVEGVVALRDGRPVGLAHYRRMPSPLRGTDVGFLDDLFVTPEARGSGAADALFDHLRATAKARGWGVVRWLTADDNYRARSLYDRVAKKAIWNVYEMTV
ncbi:GNAT family N-acetyltransferase [Oceanibacterium hippocampi]|uniref:Acetyltransferase (GNAT) family protein n=1 Tax=Oceanibacterium hippocampi TaxID=745714 RepID=A0A1Y5SJJ9_9PROT|nr:GNAT family N-acetyltransferase [Oceanibacterium hippocampi]SLN39341.1 Acetyltransferase (GNAT) family protein [Oceanibacterium hippocampi]